MGHGSLPAGPQRPAPASVAGVATAAPRFAAEPPAAASLVRHQRWQALCTIALGSAQGRPQVWRATQSALQTRELREVKKKQEKIYSKAVGVGGGICQKSVKSISTVVDMHLLMTVPKFKKTPGGYGAIDAIYQAVPANLTMAMAILSRAQTGSSLNVEAVGWALLMTP